MASQNATTGNLANVQETIINAARFVQEHNAPSWQLIEKFLFPKAHQQLEYQRLVNS